MANMKRQRKQDGGKRKTRKVSHRRKTTHRRRAGTRKQRQQRKH